MKKFSTVALATITIMSSGLIVSPAIAAPSRGVQVDCVADSAALQPAINSAAAGSSLNIDGTCLGNFTINKDLTLSGPATLDAQSSGTTVTVPFGVTATFNQITVTGGTNSGIVNSGNLKMSRSAVSGNSVVGNGGGIYNNAGNVLLNSTIISGNSATGNGGGIYSTGAPPASKYKLAPLTLAQDTVSGNTASENSGGIWADNETKIASSDFSGNGGIPPYFGVVVVPSSLLTVTHSTFVV